VQEMIDLVEASRNIHVHMRFHTDYLSYLSEMLLARGRQSRPERESSSDDSDGSPRPRSTPTRKTAVLREVKSLYWFDAATVGTREEEKQAKDIVWEVESDGHRGEDVGAEPAAATPQGAIIPQLNAPELPI